jgi:ABC-type lipoprotein export system ATPase subunit
VSWEKWLEEDDVLPAQDAAPGSTVREGRQSEQGRQSQQSRRPRYEPGSHRFGEPLPGREPVRELIGTGLGFARAGRTILEDVAIEAFAGEPVAVTGPSGSGKSSLLALLAGLERPDSGTVRVDGKPLPDVVPDGFGLILQGYGLVSVLTAAENVEVALQGRGLPREEVRDRAAAALEAVALEQVADHLVEQLSGGQQQRVAVARALAVDPAVLLADEFTAELDADSRSRILALVLGVARRGAVVVIATHDPEVAQSCHTELRLVDGRIEH